MTFTDHFDGLSRTEHVTRVQALASQHGCQLTDFEAGQALNPYAVEAVAECFQDDITYATLARTISGRGHKAPDAQRALGDRNRPGSQ